jgi:hypothetical protein
MVFLGVLLVLVGVLMLLERLGIIYGDVWEYVFPIALIALGVSFMVKKGKNL